MNGIEGVKGIFNTIYAKLAKLPEDRVVAVAIEQLGVHGAQLTDKQKYLIFKLAAAKNPHQAAEQFPQFTIIPTQKYQYRAAKFLAKNNTLALITYAALFFPMESSKRSKIVAKAITDVKNLRFVLLHFKKFGLTLEEALPLALQAAQLDGRVTAEYFPCLGIDQATAAQKYQVVEALFRQNAHEAGKFIDHFQIEDEEQRMNLYLLHLQCDPDKALALSQTYRINSHGHLMQAAGIAAKFDGWTFSTQVAKWNFENEKDRLVLAQQALRSHLTGALLFIHNYHLSPNSLLAIFVEAIQLKAKAANASFDLFQYVEKTLPHPELKYQLALRYSILDPQGYLKESHKWGFAQKEIEFLEKAAREAQK